MPNKDPRLSPKTPRYIPAIFWEGFAGGCRPWWGGWGSDDNDNDPRGNDDVDKVPTLSAHITINLSDKEKGGLSDEEKGRERLLWT